jgi:hypothetical protein
LDDCGTESKVALGVTLPFDGFDGDAVVSDEGDGKLLDDVDDELLLGEESLDIDDVLLDGDNELLLDDDDELIDGDVELLDDDDVLPDGDEGPLRLVFKGVSDSFEIFGR